MQVEKRSSIRDPTRQEAVLHCRFLLLIGAILGASRMLCRNGFQRLVHHPNVHTAPQFVNHSVCSSRSSTPAFVGPHLHLPHATRSFASYASTSRTKIIRIALKKGFGGRGPSRIGVFRFQTQAQLDRLLQRYVLLCFSLVCITPELSSWREKGAVH